MVLTRMKSGYAVIGDTQFLPGYCVLLAYPKAASLNDLNYPQRADFLLDMSLLGEAVQTVCDPIRVNCSIYGNSDAYLHAHVFPRYEWEPEERKRYPVWQYPAGMWSNQEFQYMEHKHGPMKAQITDKLKKLMRRAH